jgi:phosphate butyryltransferase
MIFSFKDLLEEAKKKSVKKRLAIAAAEDIYVMRALKQITDLGLISPVLIGNKEQINTLAHRENILIDSDSIIATRSDQESAFKAVELIRNGKADMLMKGMVATKTLLVEVLQTETGISYEGLLSHLALFESPYYHKVFGLTDAAINIAPTCEEKIQIIRNATNCFIQLGVPFPKVALLAAIEKVNPKMQATVDAAWLVDRHNEKKIADCRLEGPMALDLAISAEASSHKKFSGEVPGDADILVVPEITCGNVIYKTLTCLGGAKTAGVVVGAKAPIILTSRADSEESKLVSIALAMNLSRN